MLRAYHYAKCRHRCDLCHQHPLFFQLENYEASLYIRTDIELFYQFSCGKLKNPQTHKLVELLEHSLNMWFCICKGYLHCFLHRSLIFTYDCLNNREDQNSWCHLWLYTHVNLIKVMPIAECMMPHKRYSRWGNVIRNDRVTQWEKISNKVCNTKSLR